MRFFDFRNKIKSYLCHFIDIIKNQTAFAFIFTYLQGMTKYRNKGVYKIRHILETIANKEVFL